MLSVQLPLKISLEAVVKVGCDNWAESRVKASRSAEAHNRLKRNDLYPVMSMTVPGNVL